MAPPGRPRNSLSSIGKHGEVRASLGDEEPSTRIEAQACLETIRSSKGYLDAEALRDLQNLKPHIRDTLLSIVEQNRKTTAEYTKSVAQQLYSSKYRFLYELIQNADDSLYTKPTNRTEPYLRLAITQEKIVVDTNEDGFRRVNIEAICATGQSSKKASVTDDHIGEKGFGFKSIFAVANEVHIQSGIWSFRFKHAQGEDGLGMLTPLDATSDVLPPDVTTRITLHLTNRSGNEYIKLLEAVRNVPETTMLFLQKLKRIVISTEEFDDHIERHITTATKRTSKISSISVKYVRGQGQKRNSSTTTSWYHHFKHTTTDMPPDSFREGRDTATIELAFPTGKDLCQPKLNQNFGQYIFAYLPLQRFRDLQFLIHSDFVTSANRESVLDCEWNKAISEGIADAFVMAVTSFVEEDTSLRYSWLDYLPKKLHSGPLASLYPLITERLKNLPILETWSTGDLKPPTQLRLLQNSEKHNGKPLFSDLPGRECYLAPDYDPRHDEKLKDLGVRLLTWAEFVDRLQYDVLSIKSRLKTKDPAAPWHDTFARYMLSLMELSGATTRERVKRLSIVPLMGRKQWTGAPGVSSGGQKNVYFSHTGSIPIPESLKLSLLDRFESQSVTRKKFYRAFGVEECPKELVFKRIRKVHEKTTSRRPTTEIPEHAELRYLFHYHENLDELRTWVHAPSEKGDSVAVDSLWYFSSSRKYDLYQLLSEAQREELGFLHFISSSLLLLESSSAQSFGRSWREWLQELTSAQTRPRLVSFDGVDTLSKELKAVNQADSTKFLGALKAHWHEYEDEARQVSNGIEKQLVLCTNGEKTRLSMAYFPTPAIIQKITDFGLDESDFYILVLPGHDLFDESQYQQWQFLERFGVTFKPTMQLYKDTLEVMMGLEVIPELKHVKGVYVSMARIVTLDEHEDLREFFKKIWDPERRCWVDTEDCIWSGPEFLTCKSVLERSYGKSSHLTSLFTTVLELEDCTIENVLEELEFFAESDEPSAEKAAVTTMYQFLNETAGQGDDEDWDILKDNLTRQKLILGENDTWYSLDKCLWRSAFKISGLQDLSTLYPDLEDFFVGNLGVRKATPSLLIKEVKFLASAPQPKIDELHTRLVEVGMILSMTSIDSKTENALDALKDLAFLPKKQAGGTSTLVKISENFAISDHVRYGEALAGKDILLDFKVDEVQILHILFQHYGLTDRYLSSTVKEVSTVVSDSWEDEQLSQQLQLKAYALYCCAAKYKSVRAFRGDQALFNQLKEAVVHTTSTISTKVVLKLGSRKISVESDRCFIHHEIMEGKFKIYVPTDLRLRRACYRSQLPRLIANIMRVGSSAEFNISSIISADPAELDLILTEQDITPVEWIERPIVSIHRLYEDEPAAPLPRTPSRHVFNDSEASLVVNAQLRTSRTSTPRLGVPRNTPSPFSSRFPPQTQFAKLIQQIVRYGQRASLKYTNPGAHGLSTLFGDQEPLHFDNATTFGNRDENPFAHDKKIGAAGEAYVFELLSGLALPRFSRENWRSTIRGVLSCAEHYSSMQDWQGRETADIVYKDATGALTRFLRSECTGGFPDQIEDDHDHAAQPIKYFLEVKTTTGDCSQRFFISPGQYGRMADMELEDGVQSRRVYVIMRVYELTSSDIAVKIFVDPIRLDGEYLDFEVQQWIGKVL